MPGPELLPTSFEAALFDLDGTLVATDRFWIQAARVGARRAFQALGLERPLPSSREWMGLVGKPLETGFAELLPELAPAERDLVRAACVEEEHRLLAEGGDVLMPGAHELLGALRAAGTRIGVASNCSRSYLEHMLGPRGLGKLVDAAYCLDSPGVATKADMIACLLADFGTRRAFFVGDRQGDRDAAWENGLPHVHCAFGFASGREDVAAEATIEDLGELPLVLGRRRGALDAAVGALRPATLASQPRPPAVGVGGPPGAGKSLLVEELAPLLARATGREVARLATDALRPAAGSDAAGLAAHLLEAHARGEALELEVELPAEAGGPGRERVRVPAGALLLLEGRDLLEPGIRPRLDRLLWLAAPDARLLSRIAGRDAREQGLSALDRARRGLEATRALERRYPPERHADLLLDAANPFELGPPPRPGAAESGRERPGA